MSNNGENYLIAAESIGGNYCIGYTAGVKHLQEPGFPIPMKIDNQKPSVMARGFIDAITGNPPFYKHSNAGNTHRSDGTKKTVILQTTMSFGCTLVEEEKIQAKAKLMGVTPAAFMRTAVLEKL